MSDDPFVFDSEIRLDGLYTPDEHGIEQIILEASNHGWVVVITDAGGKIVITDAGMREWINRRLPPDPEQPQVWPPTRRAAMTKVLDVLAQQRLGETKYGIIDAATRSADGLDRLIEWMERAGRL